MSYHLAKLKDIHRIVARYLAMGYDLEQICNAHGLNLTSWKQITTAPLFIEAKNRIHVELEDSHIDEHINDPVQMQLKMARRKATDRIIEEVDNFDKENEGATSSTRLKAAEDILHMTGDFKEEGQRGAAVVINLAESVLNNVLSVSELPKKAAGKSFTEADLQEATA